MDRRHVVGRDVYPLARGGGEFDRLDVVHHILAQLLGADYLAPIEQPARILDVGSGTGTWAFGRATEFPEALVVGLDLQAGRPGAPVNYAFLRASVLAPNLPLAGEAFDFVHQRLLTGGVPVARWPAAVAELVRVTRPGGWVELVESASSPTPEGPASARLFRLLRQMAEARGLDQHGVVATRLADYLREAGMVDVAVRTVECPVGEWGGWIGYQNAAGFRALFTHMAPTFQARFGLPAAECMDLVRQAARENEELRPTFAFFAAYGRRP